MSTISAPSTITRFSHEAYNAPRMPHNIQELVLPTQFGLPMVPPVDLPLKKSKKEKKRARQPNNSPDDEQYDEQRPETSAAPIERSRFFFF